MNKKYSKVLIAPKNIKLTKRLVEHWASLGILICHAKYNKNKIINYVLASIMFIGVLCFCLGMSVPVMKIKAEKEIAVKEVVVKTKVFKKYIYYITTTYYGQNKKGSMKWKNGKNFTGESMTCASDIFPRYAILRVTYNGISQDLWNCDGGIKRKYVGLDIAKKPARKFGILRDGIVLMKVELIGMRYPKKS